MMAESKKKTEKKKVAIYPSTFVFPPLSSLKMTLAPKRVNAKHGLHDKLEFLKEEKENVQAHSPIGTKSYPKILKQFIG